MDLSKITSGNNVPKEINVIIEISQNSDPVKYELNKETNLLHVDRFLPTAMYYPCNYGFIPHTYAGDGDPLDVLVVTRFPVIPGSLVGSRPIGVLFMQDESGEDAKILSVPTSKVDPYYDKITNFSDFPQTFLDSIKHFFCYYKKLEEDKFVEVNDWQGVEVAEKLILNSLVK